MTLVCCGQSNLKTCAQFRHQCWLAIANKENINYSKYKHQKETIEDLNNQKELQSMILGKNQKPDSYLCQSIKTNFLLFLKIVKLDFSIFNSTF